MRRFSLPAPAPKATRRGRARQRSRPRARRSRRMLLLRPRKRRSRRAVRTIAVTSTGMARRPGANLKEHIGAFSPHEIRTLVAALDTAWESIQASGVTFETSSHAGSTRAILANILLRQLCTANETSAGSVMELSCKLRSPGRSDGEFSARSDHKKTAPREGGVCRRFQSENGFACTAVTLFAAIRWIFT